LTAGATAADVTADNFIARDSVKLSAADTRVKYVPLGSGACNGSTWTYSGGASNIDPVSLYKTSTGVAYAVFDLPTTVGEYIEDVTLVVYNPLAPNGAAMLYDVFRVNATIVPGGTYTSIDYLNPAGGAGEAIGQLATTQTIPCDLTSGVSRTVQAGYIYRVRVTVPDTGATPVTIFLSQLKYSYTNDTFTV